MLKFDKFDIKICPLPWCYLSLIGEDQALVVVIYPINTCSYCLMPLTGYEICGRKQAAINLLNNRICLQHFEELKTLALLAS